MEISEVGGGEGGLFLFTVLTRPPLCPPLWPFCLTFASPHPRSRIPRPDVSGAMA